MSGVTAKPKVCCLYLEGLSPRKGGGVANNLYGLISSTYKMIDYSLITACDQEDLRMASSLYGLRAEIKCIQLRKFVVGLVRLTGHYQNLACYDVVHFNDFYGSLGVLRCLPLILLLRVLSQVKLIFSFHTAGIEESIGDGLPRGLYNFLFRRISLCWHKIVCSSAYMAQSLVERYGIPRSKIVVIPGGVDVEFYQKAQTLRLVGKPAILFVGHLQPGKGVDLVLNAFRLLNEQIPGSHLHLVGTGRYAREYKELIRELNIEDTVQLHGHKSRDELSRIYKGADICVFPSRVDAFPSVVLEAMASGKPIVATNVGGIPEIIKCNRNGLLVEPNVDSVMKALLKLSRDRDLCESMSKNNERDSIRYSWKRVSEMYVHLYLTDLHAARGEAAHP